MTDLGNSYIKFCCIVFKTAYRKFWHPLKIKVTNRRDWISTTKLTISRFQFILLRHIWVRHRGVVGRVPVFQPGGPGSIPGRVRNFNFYPRTGCVYSEFSPVLSLAVALIFWWPHIQGSPPLCICRTFWPKVCCSPTGIWPMGIWVVSSRGRGL